MAVEREINLFAILDVMWERGKGILLFSLGAMVIGAAITMLIHDRFVAKAQLVMNKSKLGEQTMQNPAIPLDTYLELACSQELMHTLLDRFKLTSAPYNFEYPEDLLPRIEISIETGTSLLDIQVELEDAEIAAEIANAVANDLIDKSAKMLEMEANSSIARFKKQVNDIQEEVMGKREIYEEALLKNNQQYKINVLSTLNSILAQHKQEKANLETTLSQMTAQKAEFEKLFSATDFQPVILTQKNILSDPVAYKTFQSRVGDADLEKLSSISILEEEVNQAYVSLNQEYRKLLVDMEGQKSRLNFTAGQVDLVDQQAQALQRELSKAQVEETYTKAEFDLALEIMGGIDKEEGWIGTTVNSERQDLFLITPAVAPQKKTYPRRSLMVGLVGTIAFLLAFLYYLFRDLYGLVQVGIMKEQEEKPAEPA